MIVNCNVNSSNISSSLSHLHNDRSERVDKQKYVACIVSSFSYKINENSQPNVITMTICN